MCIECTLPPVHSPSIHCVHCVYSVLLSRLDSSDWFTLPIRQFSWVPNSMNRKLYEHMGWQESRTILSKPEVWILIGFRGVAVVGQWLVMGGNLFFQISLDIEDGSGEGDIYNLILELRDIITIWSFSFINCFILFSYYHYYTSSPFLTFGSTSLLIKKLPKLNL